ncbi:hypothetical protein VNO77_33045 [Canavalia gladiata]|uniref:Uncharacterized protein n=1 Tax=Canavalia gladiata TaxID=3824 RepID=A0AAN9KCM5_CANGL
MEWLANLINLWGHFSLKIQFMVSFHTLYFLVDGYLTCMEKEKIRKLKVVVGLQTLNESESKKSGISVLTIMPLTKCTKASRCTTNAA